MKKVAVRVPSDIMEMLQYPVAYKGKRLSLAERSALYDAIKSLAVLIAATSTVS